MSTKVGPDFTFSCQEGPPCPPVSYATSQRTPFRKNVLNEISRKSNFYRTTSLKFCHGSCTIVTTVNSSVI